ncbi:O-fucosyltransferase family protein [Ectobacillus sp. sgz5001026]|uniref:O-fucosyltransferase family protein n=1 Tax=Ectobacillus sp. sgz5001026 TaxID=3242473 RepID=UPI0036D43562
MPQRDRFLLIKAWGNGFWSDTAHVVGQLLIAELTDRIPVIYWGADSLYASERPLIKDAFTMYFLPVSNYTVDHLANENYTFYPSRWNRSNLRLPGTKDLADLEDAAIANVFSRSENVVVSNVHIFVHHLIKWIKEDHPAYGLGVWDVYSYLYKKYLKLQPYLSNEIEDFYLKNMKNKHPILGVHIRGSDKISEFPHLYQLNNSYPAEIDTYLKNNPTASIFLLTDSESILTKYQQLYGDKLIYTNCIRTQNDNVSVHAGLPYHDKKQKGIDVIKDSYLATKCDHFIGASYSNVSMAIQGLKVWPEGTIKLIQY